MAAFSWTSFGTRKGNQFHVQSIRRSWPGVRCIGFISNAGVSQYLR
jgi:hypothetical protein